MTVMAVFVALAFAVAVGIGIGIGVGIREAKISRAQHRGQRRRTRSLFVVVIVVITRVLKALLFPFLLKCHSGGFLDPQVDWYLIHLFGSLAMVLICMYVCMYYYVLL